MQLQIFSGPNMHLYARCTENRVDCIKKLATTENVHKMGLKLF